MFSISVVWLPVACLGAGSEGRSLTNGTGVVAGGSKCYENWQCGYQQIENPTNSLPNIAGRCVNKQCQCESGYTCRNCALTAGQTNIRCCKAKTGVTNVDDAYCNANCGLASVDPTSASCASFCECSSTDFSLSSECVNLCSHQWGGGACTRDEQCLNGGMCIGAGTSSSGFQGTCSCAKDWGCAHCELPINDLNGRSTNGIHPTCPGTSASAGNGTSTSYVNGGARCRIDSDCTSGFGTCDPPQAGIPCSNAPVGQECTCKCGVGRGCGDCSQSASDLLQGTATCGCDNVKCPAAAGGIVENANGQCNPSTGSCDCYWPYTGTDCSVNPCKVPVIGDPCKNVAHSVCVVDQGTQQAKCECTDGWSGADCSVEPYCTQNSDCGVWAPIPQAIHDGLDPNFACSIPELCVENKYGGTCDTATGKCMCNAGFACNGTCTTRGDAFAEEGNPGSCSLGTGGGRCTTDKQCQRLGNRNYCFEGRCVCSNGFTCPLCDFPQQGLGPNQTCPIPPDELEKYSQVPGPEPTPSPTPNFAACGVFSQWIRAANVPWYTGSAEKLCVCLRGYYAVGAITPTVTISGRNYPDIPGNKPFTIMSSTGVGQIKCERCPAEYLKASCLDDDRSNWQLEDNEAPPSPGDSSGLSSGALAGVVIGGIAGAGVIYMGVMSLLGGRLRRGAYRGGPTRAVQMSRQFGPGGGRGVL